MGTVNKSLFKTDVSALHVNICQLSTQNKFQNEQFDSEVTISRQSPHRLSTEENIRLNKHDIMN
jgi:hypothetical protein